MRSLNEAAGRGGRYAYRCADLRAVLHFRRQRRDVHAGDEFQFPFLAWSIRAPLKPR